MTSLTEDERSRKANKQDFLTRTLKPRVEDYPIRPNNPEVKQRQSENPLIPPGHKNTLQVS